MKNINLNSIAAVLLMLWMWIMTIAIIELFKMPDREIDFSICPLCDRPVPIARDGWPLHPATP